MITQAAFLGGSQTRVLAADVTLSRRSPRVQVVGTAVAGLSVRLAPGIDFLVGGPIFYIVVNGSKAIKLVDSNSTVLLSMAPNTGAEVYLLNNLVGAGFWLVKTITPGFAPEPPVTKYSYRCLGLSGAYTAETDEYNQQLNISTIKSAAPEAKIAASSFVITSAMYTHGGQQGAQVPYALNTRKYDPDVWSSETDSVLRYSFHAADTLGSEGFIFGGRDLNGTANADAGARAASYLPSGPTWTTRASMSSGRGCYTTSASSVGAQIFLGGAALMGANAGYGQLLNQQNQLNAYSINVYVTKSDKPLPLRCRCPLTNDGTYLYTYGGAIADGATGTDGSYSANKYLVVTDTWSAISNIFGFQTVGGVAYLPSDLSAVFTNPDINILCGSETNPTTHAHSNSSKNHKYTPGTDSYAYSADNPIAVFGSQSTHQMVTI